MQELEAVRDLLKAMNHSGIADSKTLTLIHEIREELEKFRGEHDLSLRETQTFELLGEGLTVKEIGDRLGIKAKTVEAYRERLRQKLNTGSSHKLTVLAVQWVTTRKMQA